MANDVITHLTDADIETTWKQSVPRMEGDDDATDTGGDDDATDAGEGDDDATDADGDADATDS